MNVTIQASRINYVQGYMSVVLTDSVIQRVTSRSYAASARTRLLLCTNWYGVGILQHVQVHGHWLQERVD